MEPVQLIIWICVFTFAATVLITLFALLNLIKFPNETFLPLLFKVLIVEIVVAGVGAFSIYISEELSDVIKNRIKITSYTLKPISGDLSKINYEITIHGSYFTEEPDIYFKGSALVAGYKILIPDSTKITTDNNGTWKTSFFHTVRKGSEDDISIEISILDIKNKILSNDSYSFFAPYRLPCIDDP